MLHLLHVVFWNDKWTAVVLIALLVLIVAAAALSRKAVKPGQVLGAVCAVVVIALSVKLEFSFWRWVFSFIGNSDGESDLNAFALMQTLFVTGVLVWGFDYTRD